MTLMPFASTWSGPAAAPVGVPGVWVTVDMARLCPERAACGCGYTSGEEVSHACEEGRSAEHARAVAEEGPGNLREDARQRPRPVRRRAARSSHRVGCGEERRREEGRPLGAEERDRTVGPALEAVAQGKARGQGRDLRRRRRRGQHQGPARRARQEGRSEGLLLDEQGRAREGALPQGVSSLHPVTVSSSSVGGSCLCSALTILTRTNRAETAGKDRSSTTRLPRVRTCVTTRQCVPSVLTSNR